MDVKTKMMSKAVSAHSPTRLLCAFLPTHNRQQQEQNSVMVGNYFRPIDKF